MAGTNAHYTIREARAILAQHGITITSNDGEYRVAFAGKERRSLGLLHARWGRCDRNRHRDAHVDTFAANRSH